MSDNPLKKLVADLATGGQTKRPSKANHTLYMREPQFRLFADHCKAIGRKPSEVVDHLVAMYLKEVGIEVPDDTAA